MKSYQWCDLQFDEDYFPNAIAYLKRLKERGLKISVWLNSYVGQASPLFNEGKEKGYFIRVRDICSFQLMKQIINNSYSELTVLSGNGTCGRPEWL